LMTALDSIDSSMATRQPSKGPSGRSMSLTSDELARIVSGAVSDAVAAYERTRGPAVDGAQTLTRGGVVIHAARAFGPRAPSAVELALLRDDMGLNEITFDETAPSLPAPVAAVGLAAEMGVDGFSFDDVMPAPPPAPTIEVPVVSTEERALTWLATELRTDPIETVPVQKEPQRPLTPEEAAATIFFTFDPIPPVPPRLPRD